jgi:hypothetical protein
MEERTTKVLIETLGEDFKRCYQGLLQSLDEGTIDRDGNLNADYEFHARQLVRAVFAYIEGVTFSVKVTAAADCMQRGIEISPQERYIVAEIDYELNEKGEVVERSAHIKLPSNVRFAFMLSEKLTNSRPRSMLQPSGGSVCVSRSRFATDLCTQECLVSRCFAGGAD